MDHIFKVTGSSKEGFPSSSKTKSFSSSAVEKIPVSSIGVVDDELELAPVPEDVGFVPVFEEAEDAVVLDGWDDELYLCSYLKLLP